MVQQNPTELSPEEQQMITDRIIDMLNEVPNPTPFGTALRALADRVDRAPSILAATEDTPWLYVRMTTGAAVKLAAADMNIGAHQYTLSDGNTRTHASLSLVDVELYLFAYDDSRELHRPVDVTETIEAQS